MFNDQDDAVCHTHNRQVVQFCIHPMCNKFKPLCKKCYEDHQVFHQKKKMKGEPDIKNKFKSMKDAQNEVRQTLNQIKDLLELLEDKAYTEINLECDPETNIDSIIQELEEIKENVNREMNEFIKKLKENFEKPIKDKIMKVWEEIKNKRENIQTMLEDCEGIDIIKKTLISDLVFQTHTQRARLDDLINQRKMIKFQGVIDDDVALRFQGTFKKELENLIIYPEKPNEIEQILKIQNSQIKNPYVIEMENTNIPSQSLLLQISQNLTSNMHQSLVSPSSHYINIPKRTQSNYNFNNTNSQLAMNSLGINQVTGIYNSFIYFEVDSKNMHIFDLETKDYKVVTIKMDFNFRIGHQHIIGPDGNIYIIGGYDEDLDDENDEKYKQIYVINVNQSQNGSISNNHPLLQTDLRMETIRKYFGLCKTQNSIYIVGGFNYKEGTLRKCEKISFESKIHKTEKSKKNKTNHGLPGIEYDLKIMDPKLKRKLSNFIEIYTIELGQWDSVDISYEYSLTNFYFGMAAQINPHYIYLFGGKNENGIEVKKTYLLKVIEDVSDSQGDSVEKNITLELDLSCSNLNKTGYFINNCIIYNGQLYARLLSGPVSQDINIETSAQYSKNDEQVICIYKNNMWTQYQGQIVMKQ